MKGSKIDRLIEKIEDGFDLLEEANALKDKISSSLFNAIKRTIMRRITKLKNNVPREK